MRKALIAALIDLAESDPRVLLLTGDLGYLVVEPFAEKFPNRFINAGVAEQNLVGIATGLAEAGFVPFVYSIGAFAALRPYEFIRNGPIAHQLPVRIIGVGGGFDYGHNGITHHNLEDLGVMRLQPGITVIAPADDEQTRSVIGASRSIPGPVYIRLGKDSRSIGALSGRFSCAGVETVREGGDLVILTSGGIAEEGLRTAELLSKSRIEATVLIAACLSSSIIPSLLQHLRRFKLAVTLEDHYLCGGLGSLVAEVIADGVLQCRLIRRGVATASDGRSGSQRYLAERHGISAEAVAARIVEEFPEKRAGSV